MPSGDNLPWPFTHWYSKTSPKLNFSGALEHIDREGRMLAHEVWLSNAENYSHHPASSSRRSMAVEKHRALVYARSRGLGVKRRGLCVRFNNLLQRRTGSVQLQALIKTSDPLQAYCAGVRESTSCCRPMAGGWCVRSNRFSRRYGRFWLFLQTKWGQWRVGRWRDWRQVVYRMRAWGKKSFRFQHTGACQGFRAWKGRKH